MGINSALVRTRPAWKPVANRLAIAFLLLSGWTQCGAQASGASANRRYELRNARVAARFEVERGALRIAGVEDLDTGEVLRPAEAFSLAFHDGSVVAASEMRLVRGPTLRPLPIDTNASRLAAHLAGRELCASLAEPDRQLTVNWCAIVRDGTNYLRQEVTLIAGAKPAEIAQVRLFDFSAQGARVAGTVRGSPIVDGNFFFGFESPLAASAVENGRATSVLNRTLPLQPGQSIAYSSAMGVAAPGQMRREFLAYIEHERAHPYRTFLHYNTWYDLGGRYTEAQALNRIHALGEELVRKRGVKLDSFLFDDGWDDTNSVWGFNPGLPDGFAKIHQAAEQYGFGIGVWLSPWGGYGVAKSERIAAGEREGYEIVDGGFALSGPKYYKRFEDVCLTMIEKYGVNQFKFDGTGNVSKVFPGSLFDSDFSAAIHLIERLRRQEPDLFVNLTTGTWPSPFWLRYADSIWRGGDDHSFAGVGSWRQQWITYRDKQTYQNIVERGPLFPLNSLMLHGIIFGGRARHLDTDPDGDFTDEVHSYFGTGTDLEELYITPSLLSAHDWDVLAEAARWARSNAWVLRDTHWIGGDPGKLEVYGWASWSPARGIVVLRNPSDHAQAFALDAGKAFELPGGATGIFRAHSPWAADRGAASIELRAGRPRVIALKPFEVLTLDAVPVPR
ncbi:MAG: enterotoxin [Terracidiphilus sp.]